MRAPLHPLEVLALILAAVSVVSILVPPGQEEGGGKSSPDRAEEIVSALLYSTLRYPSGVSITVGEALFLSLKEGDIPQGLMEEVASRLDFLLSPLRYQVIFFTEGDGQPLTFGDLEQGEQRLLRYSFSGGELGVIITLEVR